MTIYATTVIDSYTCGACGIVFGLSREFANARMEDHKTWYCPNGHGRAWLADNEAERARKRARQAEKERDAALARQVHERDQRQAAENSLRTTKGHLTRQRKRAAHGVCPKCSRTFANVQAHIAGQHPGYVDLVR